MIKVLIADDQELIRESLKIILDSKPDIEVTDAVSDGLEVIRSVRENKPDIILLDIRMPRLDGVSCTKIIKEGYPDIKIIILTTFDDDEYVFNALKSENIKTVTKNEWAIIEEVAKGKSNKEIAKDLSFSEGTVRNYLSTILDKLELRDRTQLAIWAIGRGEL